MRCAWKELLSVLPPWMRKDVDTLGSATAQELRLRINAPPELVFADGLRKFTRCVTKEDLHYTVNTASQYSPWAATTARGYLTITGGHRIGICGEAIVQQGRITGIRTVTSLCIRIARDFPGIASGLGKISGSILILGPPGWGKTTLLRDLIREMGKNEQITVVDERNELFPPGFQNGIHVDVLSGCSKREAVPMLLRTMGPSCIAVDEITEPEDVTSLLQASHCGVRLLATAHAMSLSDFQQRLVYRPLLENHVFETFLILKRDKTYTAERMTEWVTSGLVRY